MRPLKFISWNFFSALFGIYISNILCAAPLDLSSIHDRDSAIAVADQLGVISDPRNPEEWENGFQVAADFAYYIYLNHPDLGASVGMAPYFSLLGQLLKSLNINEELKTYLEMRDSNNSEFIKEKLQSTIYSLFINKLQNSVFSQWMNGKLILTVALLCAISTVVSTMVLIPSFFTRESLREWADYWFLNPRVLMIAALPFFLGSILILEFIHDYYILNSKNKLGPLFRIMNSEKLFWKRSYGRGFNIPKKFPLEEKQRWMVHTLDFSVDDRLYEFSRSIIIRKLKLIQDRLIYLKDLLQDTIQSSSSSALAEMDYITKILNTLDGFKRKSHDELLELHKNISQSLIEFESRLRPLLSSLGEHIPNLFSTMAPEEIQKILDAKISSRSKPPKYIPHSKIVVDEVSDHAQTIFGLNSHAKALARSLELTTAGKKSQFYLWAKQLAKEKTPLQLKVTLSDWIVAPRDLSNGKMIPGLRNIKIEMIWDKHPGLSFEFRLAGDLKSQFSRLKDHNQWIQSLDNEFRKLNLNNPESKLCAPSLRAIDSASSSESAPDYEI